MSIERLKKYVDAATNGGARGIEFEPITALGVKGEVSFLHLSDLVELLVERDAARLALFRDGIGLSTMTWRDAYNQVAEINQQHMAERDAARAECHRWAEKVEDLTAEWRKAEEAEATALAEVEKVRADHLAQSEREDLVRDKP